MARNKKASYQGASRKGPGPGLGLGSGIRKATDRAVSRAGFGSAGRFIDRVVQTSIAGGASRGQAIKRAVAVKGSVMASKAAGVATHEARTTALKQVGMRSPVTPPRQPVGNIGTPSPEKVLPPGRVGIPEVWGPGSRGRGRAVGPGNPAPNGNTGINPRSRYGPGGLKPGQVGIEPWLMGKGKKKRGF